MKVCKIMWERVILKIVIVITIAKDFTNLALLVKISGKTGT